MDEQATTGIARLIISVGELDRSLRFYGDVLGLSVESVSAGFGTLRTGEGVPVLLHQRPTTPSATAVSIGFRVADVDSVTAAAQRAGAVFIDPPAEQPWGERMSVIADPDGHVVCLSGPSTSTSD